MAKVTFPLHGEELQLELPSHWRLLQLAQPQLRPAPRDWPQRLAETLSSRSAKPSLPELLRRYANDPIVLVVEDVTRHSPITGILDVLMREILCAGIQEDQIEVLFAVGMHPAMTAAQAKEKLGPWAQRLRWRSNPWQHPKEYRTLGHCDQVPIRLERGLVEAPLRIVITSVSPHLQAGFGGGAKMLAPGCASLETIRHLHRLGLSRHPRQLVGTDVQRNPMRRVIDRTGEMLQQAGGSVYSIQCVLDEENLPSTIAAGDLNSTQQMLAKHCSVACGVLPDEPADVVIANAYPRDHDLWQSFKAIANTQWAVRPGGAVICVTQCPAGRNGMNPPKWPLSPKWTRRIVRYLGSDALASMLTRVVPRLAGDAAFFVRMALQTIHRNAILFVSPKLHEEGPFPGVEICRTLDEAAEICDDLLSVDRPRVTAFPMGGVTYPVPRLR
jgi:nickel-dependent lactate racemase